MSANPFLARKSRPLVVGHRGVPALHQENTVAGFRRAVELGIDAVELDVRLTADGRAVVCHDEDLERLTGERLRLSKTTWDRVSKLRIRRRLPMGVDARRSEVVVDYEREESIPLLEEVLDEVASDVVINVELKLDTNPWWQATVGRVAAEVINRTGTGDRVIVTSFDLRKLRVAKRALPTLVVGFCFDDSMLDLVVPVIGKVRAHALLRSALASNLAGRFVDSAVVGADHTLVSPAVVKAVRARGLAIGSHTLFPIGSTTGKPISPTASDAAEAQRLADLGLDWLESDDPARLLELLG